MREVIDLTGLGKTAIYKQMNAGEFPRPRQVAARAVRWRASDIDAWIAALPAAHPTDQ